MNNDERISSEVLRHQNSTNCFTETGNQDELPVRVGDKNFSLERDWLFESEILPKGSLPAPDRG